MDEKLKLPVHAKVLDEISGVLVDREGVLIACVAPSVLRDVVQAINAVQQRCDGCKHWEREDVEDGHAHCEEHNRSSAADDYCRHGWKPR